ncbi:Dicer-like protein 2 [Didymosphaeria variabile]|uniref:Dicer-like protein 2 n=1 Tax=Didymosphaeria variabile TaxID=1932322 RepID=A0A9W9CC60_9PLEO|nr:Dicer-like protein 2 [Didymosphaeria variabile]KAJ4356124.1 Dicer-like protein 2 [Didymosphaeria variabile]
MNFEETIFKKNTYCYKELKALVDKYEATAAELGATVADWCLQQCIAQLHKQIRTSDQLLDWSHAEMDHLRKILGRLPLPKDYASRPLSLDNLSPKVQLLADLLASEVNPSLTALVFVEQRVWVAALAELISIHPKLRGKLSVGTFVGSSMSVRRKSGIATMIEPKNQQDTLDKFKSGDMNLIIATTVLEEGIDVSACHLVICFESPKNLKSFVQRRGRARRIQSKYIIFMADEGSDRTPAKWERLEKEMRDTYEDDSRRIKEAEEREMIHEEGDRFYRVASTDALLTLDNAVPHLHHFCDLLGSGPYYDPRPQFTLKDDGGNVAAEVTLPLAVDPALRVARSLRSWRTERMAVKDAAFEAYKMLHQSGLVKDSLLPVREDRDALAAESDKTASLIEVSPSFDPWLPIAKRQEQDPNTYHRTLLEFQGIQEQALYMTFHLPVQLPALPDLTLFWNESKRITVKSHGLQEVEESDESIRQMRGITRKILASAHGVRINQIRTDFLWLLVPCLGLSARPHGSDSSLRSWDVETSLVESASELINQGKTDLNQWGQVEVRGDERKWIPKLIDAYESKPTLRLTRVPKRRDFLYPVPFSQRGNEAYTSTEKFPASECVVEMLPLAYSVCAMLMPAILYRFEKYLATNSLPREMLRIIKGKIVSNIFFARATLSAGLDRFIIRKRFTGAKWRPRYAADVLSAPPTQHHSTISSKTLADVIESLVGASYLIGGFPKALNCMQTLLPLEPWTPLPEANEILYNAVPADIDITGLSTLESLVGYTFTKKMALLEALTHPSYKGPLANCSYERLEFLGDAVLDYIISRRLYSEVPELGHAKMHSIRTAMANAAFLAFRMFETRIAEDRTMPDMRKEVHYRCLWQFLRSDASALVVGRNAAIVQYDAAKEAIRHALHHEGVFPWHILALTDSPKFLSDIVESVIGAIYVDSHGDIAACEVLVRKLGILDCLDRILKHGVDCLHPKERLGILAVEKDIQYFRVTAGEDEVVGGARRKYKCQVRVGGVDVGDVVEGVKRLNAETVAAWEACRILEARKNEGVDGDVEMKEVIEDPSEDEEWFDAEGGVELSDG